MEKFIEPFETDYYQEFIHFKRCQEVPYLSSVALSENQLPRLDQLASFQHGISNMSENKNIGEIKDINMAMIINKMYYL